jgi:methanogenic corrinoid protein MtbC1
METNARAAEFPAPSTPAELLRALSDRIDALDRSGAVAQMLDAVAGGRISIADLYTQVLGPYLAAIGSQWQHGTEHVWQEHFASHVVRTIVEALYPSVARAGATVPARGETVLLACPPDEQHEIGLRMLADRFELAGYRAVFLGANVPISEIVAAGHAVGASIVAMSVSTVFERVELRRFVDGVREGLPSARLMLGGPAFARDTAFWADIALLDPAELGLPGSAPVG